MNMENIQFYRYTTYDGSDLLCYHYFPKLFTTQFSMEPKDNISMIEISIWIFFCYSQNEILMKFYHFFFVILLSHFRQFNAIPKAHHCNLQHDVDIRAIITAFTTIKNGNFQQCSWWNMFDSFGYNTIIKRHQAHNGTHQNVTCQLQTSVMYNINEWIATKHTQSESNCIVGLKLENNKQKRPENEWKIWAKIQICRKFIFAFLLHENSPFLDFTILWCWWWWCNVNQRPK